MHRTMIRNRKEVDLVPWIAGASDSLIGSFASGVTKLKLVKRQMYGRAKIDLLQARLIGAT
jgi:hypothetical protein